ncbi:hypothetical protein D8674_028983 [Pyrus ussuriensis x Pyrus communis]|uniref:Uncharacterized protein n=1 Tax=Pyrus ussuriensis x Pyrus communis TaxID=2448454 RepID=A0A5N5HXV9_9ROSA|nr:hypothetical protein D8674_028983 [Pyrus ussuriensis x Pyrus communis]
MVNRRILSVSCMNSKEKKQVSLEGYVEAADDDDSSRNKSLIDEDLIEFKGVELFDLLDLFDLVF